MDVRLFDGSHQSKVSYLKECARTHHRYGKYLTYGRLLEPVPPLDALPVFSEAVFGWNRNQPGTVPVAEARLWQAEEGGLAIFLANYSDDRVLFRYRLDPGQFGGKPGLVRRTESLDPASVRVVELPR